MARARKPRRRTGRPPNDRAAPAPAGGDAAGAGAGPEAAGGGGPERRCVVTGRSGPREALIRFAVAPDRTIVPDLAGRLPGRGIWVGADRAAVAEAARKRLFARAARAPVRAPEDLAEKVEAALALRAADALGLARRAGAAVAGYGKAETALRRGRAALRIEARDGAAEGRRKLDRLAPGVPVLSALTAGELARPFGRARVAHVVVLAGAGAGLVERLRRDFARLSGFRPESAAAGLEKPAGRCMEPPTDGDAGAGAIEERE